jgi:hypothetical protein
MKKMFFPYCPGIPWYVGNDKVIKTKLISPVEDVITGDINVVCHGGLLESYYSLSAFEYFKLKFPYNNLIWHGDKKYKHILSSQDIARFSEKISPKIADSYPIHLFKDANNNTYFNLLNNYLNKRSYLGNKVKTNISTFIKCFNNNFMLDDLKKWSPKFRSYPEDLYFDKWKSLYKKLLEKPYILILPDKVEKSMSNSFYIGLSINEIKGLISILQSRGIYTIVMSNNNSMYYGGINYIDYDFFRFTRLAENAKVVLSRQIDFAIISQLMFKHKIYSFYNYKMKNRSGAIMYQINGFDPTYKYMDYKNRVPSLTQAILQQVFSL